MTRALPLLAAALLVAPAPARAQVKHLQASQQLGEGTRQPHDAPYPIPDSSPRLAAPTRAAAWSARMAESVMKRNPQAHRRWDYTQGVILNAVERVGLARRDRRMLDWVKTNMDRWVKPDGTIEGYDLEEYNIDEIAQGRLLFRLLERTGDQRYRKAAELLRRQLATQPRTAEGGFWHKKIYPQQMWLDGLYMGQPFYAQYAQAFGEPQAYDDIARQFLLIARHTRDAETGLMYHAWDAARAQKWADSLTGLSPNFWGRAMGWFLVGAVETLEHFPKEHPDREALVAIVRNASEAIAKVQDPVTGLWWNILDQPNREGNYLEGSASSMFAYALARAANRGYVDARYRGVAERAFGGLVRNLVRENPDGTISLTNIVQVSGLGGNLRRDGSYRDGSFAYYASEPVVTDDYKGLGPFILAALELGR